MRFLLVADRGMYSGTNMCHVLDAGNGYIVSKSLRRFVKGDVLDRKAGKILDILKRRDVASTL